MSSLQSAPARRDRTSEGRAFWAPINRLFQARPNGPDLGLAAQIDQDGHSRSGRRLFDARYYLDSYPDVGRSGVDPYRHYIETGWREGRDPNGWLSTRAYLARYPALSKAGENPLFHMLRMAASASDGDAGAGSGDEVGGERSLLAMVARTQPQFSSKWSADDYLVRGLARDLCGQSLFHTYQSFERSFPDSVLRKLMFPGGRLWATETQAGPIEIRMHFSDFVYNEGEISVTVFLYEQRVCVLSFNLMPETSPWHGLNQRIVISRMQTCNGSRPYVKTTTRELCNVIPQAALFAALQGVAEAMGVDTLIGVPAARQVALCPSLVERAADTYDRFYESVGAVMAPDGLYRGPILSEPKPLSAVAPGHKIRTRRKRELKADVRTAARHSVERLKQGAWL